MRASVCSLLLVCLFSFATLGQDAPIGETNKRPSFKIPSTVGSVTVDARPAGVMLLDVANTYRITLTTCRPISATLMTADRLCCWLLLDGGQSLPAIGKPVIRGTCTSCTFEDTAEFQFEHTAASS